MTVGEIENSSNKLHITVNRETLTGGITTLEINIQSLLKK